MPEAIEGVSVIVPACNAAAILTAFFANLRQCEVLEVFLCDLGSQDATVAIGRDAGAHILRGCSDFAGAANAAARQARGNVLWLLSPHCRPPPYIANDLTALFAEESVWVGYFPISAFPGADGWWRARLANFRAAWRNQVLLEHGPFFQRAWFDSQGGCANGEGSLTALFTAARRARAVFCAPMRMKLE